MVAALLQIVCENELQSAPVNICIRGVVKLAPTLHSVITGLGDWATKWYHTSARTGPLQTAGVVVDGVAFMIVPAVGVHATPDVNSTELMQSSLAGIVTSVIQIVKSAPVTGTGLLVEYNRM
jgi:uncharacterized spore protein YtfJ